MELWQVLEHTMVGSVHGQKGKKMRLIDADALRIVFTEKSSERVCGVELCKAIISRIDEMPTVDAVPVRHGKWITKSTGGEYFDCCSECGYIEWDAPSKYCPNCGVRMDEE